jgi:hypothetical protein
LKRALINKEKQYYTRACDIYRESDPTVRPGVQKKPTVQIPKMTENEEEDKPNDYLR